MKNKTRNKRRKMRSTKMTMRSGGKFKVNHKLVAGRTGSVFSKRLKGRLAECQK